MDRLHQARVHTLRVDMILMTMFGIFNVIDATLVHPEPRRVTLADISSGKAASRWVTIEGKLDPTRSFDVEKVVTRGRARTRTTERIRLVTFVDNSGAAPILVNVPESFGAEARPDVVTGWLNPLDRSIEEVIAQRARQLGVPTDHVISLGSDSGFGMRGGVILLVLGVPPLAVLGISAARRRRRPFASDAAPPSAPALPLDEFEEEEMRRAAMVRKVAIGVGFFFVLLFGIPLLLIVFGLVG